MSHQPITSAEMIQKILDRMKAHFPDLSVDSLIDNVTFDAILWDNGKSTLFDLTPAELQRTWVWLERQIEARRITAQHLRVDSLTPDEAADEGAEWLR